LAEENIPVMTFRPVRVANVSGRTNSCAPPVITTCTRRSRCTRARASSADLYAAMPPPTPRMTLFGATARRNLVRILSQDFVLHQAPAHLFHGDDSWLF